MLANILKFIVLTGFFFPEWVETRERKAALRTGSTGTGKTKRLTLLGSSPVLVALWVRGGHVQPTPAKTLKWPDIILF